MTMTRDPLSGVVDAPLFIVPRVLDALRAFGRQPRPTGLAGAGAQLDALLERLLAGVAAHPTKFWVMQQFRDALQAVEGEDREARARFGSALEQLMDILGIGSSDGILGPGHR